MLNISQILFRYHMLITVIYTMILTFLLGIFANYFINDLTIGELERDMDRISSIISYEDRDSPDDLPIDPDFIIERILSATVAIRVYSDKLELQAEYGSVTPTERKMISRKIKARVGTGGQKKEIIIEAVADPWKLVGRPSPIQLLWNLSRWFFLAVLITLPIVLTLSLLISKHISRIVQRLEMALKRLAEGERDIDFNFINDSEEGVQICTAAGNLQKELIFKEEAMRQRIQDLTHDLKGPVSGLFTQVDSFRAGAVPVEENQTDYALRELGYINLLIDEMTSLYRLEDNYIEMEIEEFETKELLDPLKKRFAGIMKERGINLEYSEELGILHGDFIMLSRAVGNLIGNALQYGEGSTVRLRIHQQNDLDVIEVISKGRIPPEDIPMLFTRYWRKSSGKGGSGLGLPIAYHIARKHEGKLTAWNFGRDETAFSLTLPHSPRRKLSKPVADYPSTVTSG